MERSDWCGCRVEVGGDRGHEPCRDDDASLALAEGELLLSYWDERGVVVFSGVEREPGRFELSARSRPRRATLQREGAGRFAGEWVEGAASGTLRVELVDPAGEEP